MVSKQLISGTNINLVQLKKTRKQKYCGISAYKQIYRVISARRPDIASKKKKEELYFLIYIAVTWDGWSKEIEKIDKYQDLGVELRRLWGISPRFDDAHNFIHAFDSLIESRIYSSSDRLYYLEQFTAGDV